MNKIISTEQIPIKLWLDDIEEGALEQAKNLANLPFAFHHIALSPDGHLGYGMPIGGVMATKDVIVPNAVGVDIGCGMCAVKTSLTEIDTDTLKKIMGEIRKQIPVGFNRHKEKQDEDLMPEDERGFEGIIDREYQNALKSLGTLGGGNHFIEIQKGSDNHIWIMIHSGSRNLGKQVADYYNKVAIELNKKWYSSIPEKWQLAFLPVDIVEGQAYIKEMQYAVDFALANRKLMMDRIIDIIANSNTFQNFDKNKMINIAHNYASFENHFGQNVWVHRKGATQAYDGQIGIIPGSQGDKSYIVKGKGRKDSFKSCSHGAGRSMSRKKAKEDLNLEEEIKKMDELGAIHGMRHKNDLDEASSSYKNIDEVMKNQEDLIDIQVELKPLVVIKG